MPPSYLKDYVASLSFQTHSCNFVSYNSLPLANQAQVLHHTTIYEPKSYLEASQDPRWVAALYKLN